MLNRLDGASFATGRATFLDAEPGKPARTASIYVRIQLGGLPFEVIALLDTGARWSVLNEPVARELGLLAENHEGQQDTLSTRFGPVDGFVVRVPLTLLAEEGDSLAIDATVFVSADWHFGNFIGYQGLLERVRFAVDPMAQDLFFGPSDE